MAHGMGERFNVAHFYIDGTTAADLSWAAEYDCPIRIVWIKASAANDSSATLAVDAEGGTSIVSATAIGDTYSAADMTLASNAAAQVSADTYIKFTLDYDGSSGTAAQNVTVCMGFMIGEG
ncbi:MAG: hypothetical protein GTO22_20705 [Gemmatimonadales bacterium]|nr:hypothetical protein [Gemmatimonadales bacterium]